jgi:hypothetical protein
MSILIQGMEMPKNCAYCPLSEYRNTSLGQILDCKRIGTVGTALRDTHDVLNRRHPNCPLIELPPHGRLIDADAVNKAMDERIEKLKDDKSIYEASCVSTALDMFAPTVIEAEGETDGR